MLTIVSYVAPTIMGWSGSMNKVASFIRPLIEQRLDDDRNQGDKFEKHVSTSRAGIGVDPLTEKDGLRPVDHRFVPGREATNG